MIKLRKSRPDEIPSFMEMEQAQDTADFIFPYSHENHLAEMNREEIIYLSIFDQDKLMGFIILALESGDDSLEFRRIVVSEKDAGTGQAAIIEMEMFSRLNLGCKRIWLDVFESNQRGQHVYQKLGYVLFKQGEYNGRPLLYYEKLL